MLELLLSFGKDTGLAPPRTLSKKESSEICFFRGCSSKSFLSMEQSSWLLEWLHRLSRSADRRMMGSEQRRVTAGFVLNSASADQEEVVKLGLREEDEPLSKCVELVLSPASPSPSGSVLSYAESWCWEDSESAEWEKGRHDKNL